MKRLGNKEYPFTQRHFVAGLFSIAVGMIITAFVVVVFRSQPLDELSEGKRTTVSDHTLFKNYTVHYPIFHKQQLDAVMTEYIQGEVDRFETSLAGKNDIRNHLTVRYFLTHYGTRTATVNFIRTERVVGKPDVSSTHRVLLDMKQRRQIGPQDIIQQTPYSRSILSKLLHDSLKQQIPSLVPAELVGLLEMPLDHIRNISLEADTMTIHLNPQGTASPQATMAIAINKSLLKDVLAEAYLAEDPDMIAVTTLPSDYRITAQPSAGNTIDPAGKLMALTFDDGPSDLTPQLLNVLDTYESHATFFVLGHLVSTYQTTLQRMVREGNEIGNHSCNHSDLRFQSPAGLDQQIMATEQAIRAATGGYSPARMRPPYGATNPVVHHYLATHNLMQTLWNVDTNDWRDRDPQVIYDRIMGSAGDGRVVLLHDIHPTSVEAAIRAIRDLKAQGYQLVTVSQLYQYR